jgi:hypothetical protein
MLNLFIGVVCIAMEESHTEIKEEVLMEAKVNAEVKKRNITGKKFRKIKEAFRLIDTNDEGSIDAQELSEAFTVADIWIRWQSHSPSHTPTGGALLHTLIMAGNVRWETRIPNTH